IGPAPAMAVSMNNIQHQRSRLCLRPILPVRVSGEWGMVFSLISEKRLLTAVAAVPVGAVSLQARPWTEAVDRPVFTGPEWTTALPADSILTTGDEQVSLAGERAGVGRRGCAETRAEFPGSCVRPVGGQHSIDLEGSTRDTRVFEIEINPVGARGPMSRFDPPETKGMPGASPIRKHISGNSLPGHFGSVGLVPEGVNLEIDASSRWGVLQVEFP